MSHRNPLALVVNLPQAALGVVAAGHVSLQPLILKKAVENGFEI